MASTLHSAMHGGILGLGTDETAIRSVFEEISGDTGELELLKKEYKRIFQRDLMKDLRSELSATDIFKEVERAFPGAMS